MFRGKELVSCASWKKKKKKTIGFNDLRRRDKFRKSRKLEEESYRRNMQPAGCNRSIAHPITLVRACYGKSFVSPSSRPLVIALSVNARLAPAACIIKLPACRNADRSLLARTSCTTHHTRARAHLASPSLFHLPPPPPRRPRANENPHQQDTSAFRPPFQPPPFHPPASTQFPLTLIYLNYILRASGGGQVCASCPYAAHVRARAPHSYACEGASVWTR